MDKSEIEAMIKAAIEANGGFLSKQEFSQTAAMITRMNKALEGLVNGTVTPDKLVEMGLLVKDGDAYKPRTAAAAPAKKEDQPAEWQVQLSQLQQQIAAKDKQIESERKQREDAEVKSAVIAALEKAGAVNPSRDYVHVLPLVKRGADGKVYVPKTNQFGAEEPTALDVAFGEFLTTNPELRKASGHAGSGTPAGSPGGPAHGGTDINALAQMSPAQYFAERAKK